MAQLIVPYTNTSSPLDIDSKSMLDTFSLANQDGGNSDLDIYSLNPVPDIGSLSITVFLFD